MTLQKVKSFSSGVLFRIAIQAYERVEANKNGQSDAIISILMSAAALEAYINELGELALMISTAEELTESNIKQLANVLSELENTNESTRLKIQFAKYILTGQLYDKGKLPYQDLDLLFKLRNSILHLKPSNDLKKDNIIKSLESKKVLDIKNDGVIMSWLSKISTKAVARWSINAVINIAEDIKQSINDSTISNVDIKSLLISNFSHFEKII